MICDKLRDAAHPVARAAIDASLDDDLLATAFAHGTDEEQGRLINAIARELSNACGQSTQHGSAGYDMQVMWIVAKLDADGRELVGKLFEFLEIDQA
jgi:hypothetical protein